MIDNCDKIGKGDKKNDSKNNDVRGVVHMQFYKGADISFVLEAEDNGMKLYREDGTACDVLELCKENGVNSIRLRIWNEPSRVKEAGGYCDLEHTVRMGKRIKEKGMHFLLDFHYSDFWADPGHQKKPAAWEQLTQEELAEAVYTYTKEVLERLKVEQCLPDMVQVGNEIRSGMLFPNGEVPNYVQLAQLVNAGIQAVRDVDSSIQVMIHLDQGGKYYYLREWFDAMFAAGMQPVDIIGISFYAFWHGTFTDLKNSMESLVERYKLPVIVVETAHPWRRSRDGFVTADQEKIAGFPAGIQEQSKVMELVMNIVASVTNQQGMGVYYWEPVVIPVDGESGWANNMGMISPDGKAFPAFKVFGFERADATPRDIVKVYHPEALMVQKNQSLSLPKEVEVLRYDGLRDSYPVVWEKLSTEICGSHCIKGSLGEVNLETQLEVNIVDKLPEYTNLVKNADYSEGEAKWMVIKTQGDIQSEINHEEEYFQVSSNQNFNFCLCQEVQITQKGSYKLSVMYRGTNTTDVKVRLYGEQVSGDTMTKVEKNIYPTDEKWMLYEIENIELKEGSFTVGVELKTPPVIGKIKSLQLCKMN